MFRVKLVLQRTPPVAIKKESARALATPKRGEFIGPPLPKGVGIPAHQTQHMHHDHVRFDVAPSSLEAFEVRVIRKSLALRRHVPDILPIVSVPYKRLKTCWTHW